MSKRLPKLLLEDIAQSAEKIIEYTQGLSYDDFIVDSKTIDAVVRNFEIIGEAANRLLPEFREQHTEINWHKIRGLRNRIVHDYFGIDYSIIWSVKEDFLPHLIMEVTKMLKNTKGM